MQPLTARPVLAAPRDPAPSRAAYRMHRLWLTPLFRALMRVGLPTFALTFSLGLYLADEGRRAGVSATFAGAMASVQQRPEFMLTLLAIDGASPELAAAIRARLDLKFPLSSFEIDMETVRLKIEDLDAVATADLRVRAGGVLQVEVGERVPAVVWRTETGLTLLDAQGHRVARLLDRTARADLPLVAGPGADRAVPEALAVLAAAGPISARLRGLVRVGERRWDLVLDRDQRILLPEAAPDRALERIIALDQAEDLLARDVLAVDLRNDQRPVLRLTPDALEDLRKTRGIATGAVKS